MWIRNGETCCKHLWYSPSSQKAASWDRIALTKPTLPGLGHPIQRIPHKVSLLAVICLSLGTWPGYTLYSCVLVILYEGGQTCVSFDSIELCRKVNRSILICIAAESLADNLFFELDEILLNIWRCALPMDAFHARELTSASNRISATCRYIKLINCSATLGSYPITPCISAGTSCQEGHWCCQYKATLNRKCTHVHAHRKQNWRKSHLDVSR